VLEEVKKANAGHASDQQAELKFVLNSWGQLVRAALGSPLSRDTKYRYVRLNDDARKLGAPKKLRPGFGGSLAARDPVWDGEGWGCDRVA
jgi:hypothetical protein